MPLDLLLHLFVAKHIFMKHQQFIIQGKVENTGFRLFALRGASKYGLCGEILEKDGKIIVDVEGDETKLRFFEEWCRKGPEGSHVETLICTDKEVIGYEYFKIL